jgi:hypothetical protein
MSMYLPYPCICFRPVEYILAKAIVPNLVWKVGRVEATVRKVTLAACFGLLKAGAVKPESMYKVAAELVPLLVSHLDDSDISPRQLAAFCLSIIFERLK